MRVAVDQSGQDMEAARVDHLVGGRTRRDAERRDASVAHADIGLLHAPGQDAGAVADQQVVMSGHRDCASSIVLTQAPFPQSRWKARAVKKTFAFAHPLTFRHSKEAIMANRTALRAHNSSAMKPVS